LGLGLLEQESMWCWLRPSLISTDWTLLQQMRPMPREQYEVIWKDYYEILQVHPKAEPEVILAAYRKLAQVYHPDRNKNELATQKFQEINEAEEVLSDPDRRARYDEAYLARQGSTNGGWRAPESDNFYWSETQNNRQADRGSRWQSSSWTTDEREDTWYYYQQEPSRQERPERNQRSSFFL